MDDLCEDGERPSFYKLIYLTVHCIRLTTDEILRRLFFYFFIFLIIDIEREFGREIIDPHEEWKCLNTFVSGSFSVMMATKYGQTLVRFKTP
jgi:hypothetical protein